MSRTWNKDKIAFEQRCQKVLKDSEQEANIAHQNSLTQEQAKTRQERFD